MNEELCSQCGQPWEEDEPLQREDNGERVCPECSGLLADEDLSCQYEETG